VTDGLKDKHRQAIIEILAANSRVEKVVLFGSRAMGTFTPTSDVDIALLGDNLTLTDQAHLAAAIAELPMAQQVDIVLHKSIRNEKLIEHIKRYGVEWHRRSAAGGSEWQHVKLGDVIAVNPSRPLSKGSDSVYISMQQLESANRKIGKVDHRAFKGSGSRFQNGDTLLARITPCLENGKTAFVDFLEDGEIGHGSTEFIVLSGIKDVSDNLFVYYLARYPEFRNFAIVRMEGSSGRQRVPAPTLKEYTFAFPSYDEQRAIAHILGTLDDKIELNRRMNATLEAMARALFKSWFVDFDPVWENIKRKEGNARAQGRKDAKDSAYPGAPSLPEHILALFPDSFEDSALGPIPRGWRVGKLGNIAELNPESWGKNTAPAEIEYVDLSNTKWGKILSTVNYTWLDAPSRAQRILRPGDTIVGTVRPGNGSYALIARYGLTGSTGFAVLRPHHQEWIEYLYLSATTPENIKRLAHLADGAAYPAVRPSVVTETITVIPDERVIERFHELIAPSFQRIATHDEESRTLAALRDTLLPRLISGELRVPDVERFLVETGV